jgi:hypothetical protein
MPILPCGRALLVGIGLDQARIDGKASPSTRPGAMHVSTTRSNTRRKTSPFAEALVAGVKMPNDLG